MIIALEGMDYTGKTTVAKMLATGFHKAVVMRDPGTTPFGEKLREILLDPGIKMTPRQLMLVFIATHDALMDHAHEWEQANPDGLVILDRCFISNLAYRHADGDLFTDALHIGRVSGSFQLPPESIFYLYVNENERNRRRDAAGDRGKDRFESKPPEFWKRLAEGYKKAGEEYGYTTIDGFGTPHEVASRIYNKLDGTKILKVW
jgi:dTMP kinase